MPNRVSVKGRGADLFFGDYTPPPPRSQSDANQSPITTAANMPTSQAISQASPERDASQPIQKRERKQDSISASTLASYQPSLIESIRRQIKVAGREVSFVRLTQLEKEQLADVIYTLKKQGKRTTENEINRIAVNFILHDYQVHGDASILSRVIDALLA